MCARVRRRRATGVSKPPVPDRMECSSVFVCVAPPPPPPRWAPPPPTKTPPRAHRSPFHALHVYMYTRTHTRECAHHCDAHRSVSYGGAYRSLWPERQPLRASPPPRDNRSATDRAPSPRTSVLWRNNVVITIRTAGNGLGIIPSGYYRSGPTNIRLPPEIVFTYVLITCKRAGTWTYSTLSNRRVINRVTTSWITYVKTFQTLASQRYVIPASRCYNTDKSVWPTSRTSFKRNVFPSVRPARVQGIFIRPIKIRLPIINCSDDSTVIILARSRFGCTRSFYAAQTWRTRWILAEQTLLQHTHTSDNPLRHRSAGATVACPSVISSNAFHYRSMYTSYVPRFDAV